MDKSHHLTSADGVDCPADWDDHAWTELTGFGALAPELAAGPAPIDSGYATWLPGVDGGDQNTGLEPNGATVPTDVGGGYTIWLPDTRHSTAGGAALDDDAALKTREPAHTTRIRVRVVLAGLSTLASVIAISAGAWLLSTISTAPTTQQGTAQPAPAPAPDAIVTTTSVGSWCEILNSPERVSGNGVGSRDSGPQVILALEHAYYLDRTAAAVRLLLAPDGRFGSDEEIQAGIDAVPAGTTHCTSITAAGTNQWSVAVTERRPLGSIVVHHQTISTTRRDGLELVVAVEPA
ncbi:hypothetical protein ACIHDR_45990 [Nocardia sp. NPDC052278]|uniref:hypothetical protein n=1 Tax=unclassified Nocardia TaxID=2637762 RepID=UPI0036C0308A